MSDINIKEELLDEESSDDSSVWTRRVKVEIDIEPIEVEIDPDVIKQEPEGESATDGAEQTSRDGELLASWHTPLGSPRSESPATDQLSTDHYGWGAHWMAQSEQLQSGSTSDGVNDGTDNGFGLPTSSSIAENVTKLVLPIITNTKVKQTDITKNRQNYKFNCLVCGRLFNRTGNLAKHMLIHTGETPFGCSVCGKRFNRSSHVTTHMRTHTGEAPYACSICNKRFTDRSSVTTHMRIHTGDTPYRCSICGKKCNQSSSLTTHMRIHTGETPYECSYCGMKFNQSSHLSTHLRVHTRETPYECSVCGKKFTISSSLTTHMRIHTGETPYACSVCGMKFKYRNVLYRHRTRHLDDAVSHNTGNVA